MRNFGPACFSRGPPQQHLQARLSLRPPRRDLTHLEPNLPCTPHLSQPHPTTLSTPLSICKAVSLALRHRLLLFSFCVPLPSACTILPSDPSVLPKTDQKEKKMSLLRIAARGPATSFRATAIRAPAARPLVAARPSFSTSSRMRSEHHEESFEEFSAR